MDIAAVVRTLRTYLLNVATFPKKLSGSIDEELGGSDYSAENRAMTETIAIATTTTKNLCRDLLLLLCCFVEKRADLWIGSREKRNVV